MALDARSVMICRTRCGTFGHHRWFGAWLMALAIIDRIFLAHPRTAGQDYLQHQRFAWTFARALFGAACAAFIHGLLPNFFRTTASETIKRLHAQLDSRHPKPLDPGF
jgi:hypothetical protein